MDKAVRELLNLYEKFYSSNRDKELIGYVSNRNEVVVSHHDSWSEKFGCEPYDEECVLRIRSYLREKARFTFHTHPPDYVFGAEPSSHDVISSYLLDFPDLIVHKDKAVLIKPKKHLSPRQIWEIEKKCREEYLESGEDGYVWIACIFQHLPVEETEF